MNICHYGCRDEGRQCCWMCSKKGKCHLACTRPCDKYRNYKPPEPEPVGITLATIHYAKKNQAPDPKWRGLSGVVLCVGKGRGNRNALVRTEIGAVVVPFGNLRWTK